MPIILFVANVIIGFLITFISRVRQFLGPQAQRVDCGDFCNKMIIMLTIYVFLLYPHILYTLISPMKCFKSLSTEVSEQVVLRMKISPEILCEDSWHEGITALCWTFIVIYIILVPLMGIYFAVQQSYLIFHSARSRRNNTEDE